MSALGSWVRWAYEVFHDRNTAFTDRDPYIFMFDRDGIYRVMGAYKTRVGISLAHAPGIDAQQLPDDAWFRFDHGGGWVECNIINLTISDVRSKSSIVLPTYSNLFIWCGAYPSALTEKDSLPGQVREPAALRCRRRYRGCSA